MPDANPSLIINGEIYEGWTEVSVTRDIERMSGAFELKLTDKWPNLERLRAVKPGFECTLNNGSDRLVTGWLDAVDVSISTGDHTITAIGRDKTGDLVDCAAVHAGGEWIDQTIEQIASDICQPFGITVIVDAAAGHEVIRKFKLEESETGFAAIERLCRIKGLLATSTPEGALRITSASNAVRISATLKDGVGGNVLAAQASFNHAERFSTYTVKGQADGFAMDGGTDAAGPKGVATDPGITRYRPTTVLAEETVDAAACEVRAKWEASVRAGRAKRLTSTVQGWYHAEGFWRPLTQVSCDIEKVNLAGDMLISAVTNKISDGGTTTELTLADPRAFTGLAVPQPADTDWGWGS